MKSKIKSPVAILGFGVEGQAALNYLSKNKIKDIVVYDENNPDIPPDFRTSAQFKCGPDSFKDLTGFATIIRSPGIKYNRPEIEEARNKGAVITSMTEMTLEEGRHRITAVTGSNGKTTTTALAAEILKARYGPELIVGGNDRKPVLQEAEENPEWPILMEVSSFQFADIRISPHISAVLNITPNHMDWHDDLSDYIHAKNNLIKHQTQEDWAVLNAENENSAKLAAEARSRIFWINKKRGDYWAVWEAGSIIVNNAKIIDRGEIKVKTHPDNLLFAAVIGILNEVPVNKIKTAMSGFKGVEQRLEFVRSINGINFYNDSACTTPESAEVAINQFPEGELILLLGGSTKHSDFSFLASNIVRKETRVYLYGQEGPKIKKVIQEKNGSELIINCDQSNDFETIIQSAFKSAGENDNIVLSPACASFDMFKNSKDRGKKFKEIVNKIK